MRKTIVLLLVLVLALASFGPVVGAIQPDRTYTYDNETPVPSTNAYQVMAVVDEAVMTTKLNAARDIFVDDKDYIYIADTGNGRIVILDNNYQLYRNLTEFKYGEETLTLAVGVEGVFYRSANERLYIADTANDRIIVSDIDGNVSKIFYKPVDVLLDDKPFQPKKIIVDNMGIMYVTSGNINTGALLIDSGGNFLGFYGTNKLKETTAMKVERMWRKIMKRAESYETFQPVEFNNIFWSEDRFVYTVSPLVESIATPISKLNALGNNVFPQAIDLVELNDARGIKGMVLVDITVDDEGAITIIDGTTGHLFQYDEGCNLLAVFGGIGYQQGLFRQPTSVESDSKNRILVLDAAKNTITVMKQTFYGEMIRKANLLYTEGRYEESIAPWMEVLRMNANYTQAYVGLGKAYIGRGKANDSKDDYRLAMEYFKLGKDQEGYGEAKALLRDQIVRENFALVAAIVVIGMILILGWDGISNIVSKLYWRIRR